ncbi:OmpA family protein [Roseovarius sp.]|uniref:OmpA family protein n=1 Tax=Roseovarius sp. TaxID=1486281 RepID=UPI002601CFC0|nr:OmpA family protein [Roseovarius sp.]MDM8165482.1 OmpA family protein [Roseovarius sp.]
MKRNWLKSTTALAVVIGLATPHGAIAQSAENSTTGITLEGEAEANTNANALGDALGLKKDEEEEAQNEPAEEAEAEQAQEDNSAEQGATEEAEDLREQLETAADAEEVTDQAQDNAGEVADQASDTAEEATENAEEVVDEATETADEATDTAQDTAEEATENAQDTAEDTTENAQDTAEQAEENVEEAVEEAQENVEESTEQAQENTGGAAEDENALDKLRNSLGGDADADAEAEATADTDATVDDTADGNATADADADANAEAAANANAEVEEEVVEEAMEKAEVDDVEQLSAEQQAEQAAQTAADTGAAALSGVGELLDRTQETVTEEQARSSNEEFETDISGQARANARAAAQADDDDDDLKEVLGAAAVGLVGAYLVGQSFQGGGQVVSNTGDRIVVEDGGQYRVIRDDNALLRRPGSTVETETYSDGSTRTIIDHEDGSRVVTVRSNNGAILQRVLIRPDGQEIVLIDDTRDYQQVDVTRLQQNQAQSVDYNPGETDQLRAALAAQGGSTDRAYSLNQVRNINVVRNQVPVISLDSINFETNSAVIQPEEAEELQALGDAMRQAIEENPQQLFLVEGHTDTVGRAAYNLALSDRRAESVALALTEYFNVPASNLIVQGYGESDLKVQQTGDIRENRRAAVRNITPLLNGG